VKGFEDSAECRRLYLVASGHGFQSYIFARDLVKTQMPGESLWCFSFKTLVSAGMLGCVPLFDIKAQDQ
jgi:hypothetical protein